MSRAGSRGIRRRALGKERRRSEYGLRLCQTHQPRLHLPEYICFRCVPQARYAPIVVAKRIDDAKLFTDRIRSRPVGVDRSSFGIRWAARRASTRSTPCHEVINILIEVRHRVIGRAVANGAFCLKILAEVRLKPQ